MQYGIVGEAARIHGINESDMMRFLGVETRKDLYIGIINGAYTLRISKPEYVDRVALYLKEMHEQIESAENEGMVHH